MFLYFMTHNDAFYPPGSSQEKVFYTNSAQEAYQTLCDVYEFNLKLRKAGFKAYYPFCAFHMTQDNPLSDLLEFASAYGYVSEKGWFGSTFTRPHLFEHYILEQLSLLLQHHPDLIFCIGTSESLIPDRFCEDIFSQSSSNNFSEDFNSQILNSTLSHKQPIILSHIHDAIANGQYLDPSFSFHLEPWNPLQLFTALRTDYSLNRIHHYTGVSPQYIQKFIILVNYHKYVPWFCEKACHILNSETSRYTDLVLPYDIKLQKHVSGSKLTQHLDIKKLPQMPAYNLVAPNRMGITLIDIGVGPSNAKTMTDHLAVLRPHVWIMLGHCAGLRSHQKLGDYVLANGYCRHDHVLDEAVPLWVPIPNLFEVQEVLWNSIQDITGWSEDQSKKRVRTGTVMSIDDRNWELNLHSIYPWLLKSRSVAVDMETTTIAANGFRFRVPYGALLCVSDKPLHNELKLKHMADSFYEAQITRHLDIGMHAMEQMSEHILQKGERKFHSRKLRGHQEPPFR
jgi:AMP nucleosidase